MDPWGNDIQVQYWVDSLGFHQTDNRPQFELQPVTDTPEVRKAREEHERLWKEAARLNGVDPDVPDLYSSAAEKLENENYDDEDQLEGQVSNQQQSLTRYPVLPYTEHIAPDNAKSFGKVSGDSVIVDTNNNNNQRSRFARQQQNEVEEVTSEPRGFFYSFDYQVPFIVDRNARLRQTPEAQASEQIDVRVDSDSENYFDEPSENVASKIQQLPRVSENIRDKIVPEEEVHDVQTSPKQKYASVSEKIRDGYVAAEEVHDEQASPKQKINRGRGSVKFGSKN